MALRELDLKNLVKHIFEIDNYKSKLGDDGDICVISFTVFYQDPAKDLENFFEMGYDFVLDADCTPGELEDGNYRVFVEIERSRHLPNQIMELIDGLEKLTGIENFRFRYYKNFKSKEATLDNLEFAIPKNKNEYDQATSGTQLENFNNFFAGSYQDSIELLDESIIFKRTWGEPLTFNIIASGTKREIYDLVKGPIILEGKDVAEVMYLTKYIGNYNITKIGSTFIFESRGHAVALTRNQ